MKIIPYSPASQPAPPNVDVPHDLILDFGKRKGLAVSWVAEHDITYALWLLSRGFVQQRVPLWLCLRRHVGRALVAQDADHEAGMVA